MVRNAEFVKLVRLLSLEKARLCKRLGLEKNVEIKRSIKFRILEVDSDRIRIKDWR